MDAEILHTRLAAAEGAIIRIDERLDALTGDERPEQHAEALTTHEARLSSLEETLTQCISRLETMENTAPEAEAAIAQAEAVEAEAAAEQSQAEALAVLLTEAEPEPEAELAVEEIAPEPESENEGGPEKPRSNWLENLLALR